MILTYDPSMGPKGPFQTRPIFGPYYNRWGCDISSVFCLASYVSGGFYTDDAYLSLYKRSMGLGYIEQEIPNADGSPHDGCDVEDYKALFNFATNGRKVVSVYKLTEGAVWTPAENEVCALKCARDAHPGFHFMVSNGQPDASRWQNEIFHDPIEFHTDENGNQVPGSWTQFDGRIVGRTVFVLE